MLLACDLPHARNLTRLLIVSLREAGDTADGLVVTSSGHRQWLAGIYRRTSVEEALERSGAVAGASMRNLLGDLRLQEVQDPQGLSRDIDTPEDLEAFTGEREMS